MVKNYIVIVFAALICLSPSLHNSGNFVSKESTVSFVSKANLEKITAKSGELTGTLDIHKRTFAFSVPICSFQGFVNSKQKKHYCEKYVEGDKFPVAAFKGKIVDDADMSASGVYNVRAKGMLLLHGIEKETFVNSQVTVKDGHINIESKFTITLADYNMKLSKMNTLVIAKIVNVETKITMAQE